MPFCRGEPLPNFRFDFLSSEIERKEFPLASDEGSASDEGMTPPSDRGTCQDGSQDGSVPSSDYGGVPSSGSADGD